MEEKDGKLEERNNLINTKLTWETPKLYMLDKGKTEGGAGGQEPTEGPFYTFS